MQKYILSTIMEKSAVFEKTAVFEKCLKSCFRKYASIIYNINYYYIIQLYKYGPKYINADREMDALFATQNFVKTEFVDKDFRTSNEVFAHIFKIPVNEEEMYIDDVYRYVNDCNDIFSTIIDDLCIIYNNCYKNDDVSRILTNVFIRNINYTNGLLMEKIVIPYYGSLRDKQKNDIHRICDIAMTKYIDIIFNDVIMNIIDSIYSMNVITIETLKKYLIGKSKKIKKIEKAKTITVDSDIIDLIIDNIRQIVQILYKDYNMLFDFVKDTLKALRIIIKENCFGCITMDYRKFKEYFIVRT